MFQIFGRYLNIYEESKLKTSLKLRMIFDLFLNGPNFMRNGTIISTLLIKVILFTSYSPEVITFTSRIMNIRVLAKVLILTAGIFWS